MPDTPTIDTVEPLFSAGLDGWNKVLSPEAAGRIDSQLAASNDREADRARIANKAFIAASTGRSANEVNEFYPQFLQTWFKQVLDEDAPDDDQVAYQKIAGWYKRTREEQAMNGEVSQALLQAFEQGQPFEKSYASTIARFEVDPRWNEAHRDFYLHQAQGFWDHLQKRAPALQPAIEATRAYYKEAAKGGFFAGAELTHARDRAVAALTGLDQGDASLVMGLAAAGLPAPERGPVERLKTAVVRGASRIESSFVTGFEIGPGAGEFLAQDEIASRLEAIAYGQVDPNKTGAWYKDMWTQAAESMPTLAALAVPGAQVILFFSHKGDAYLQARASGLDRDAAETVSTGAAIVSTALDFVGARMVGLGKVPGVSRLLAPIRSPAQRTIGAIAARLGTTAAVAGVEQAGLALGYELTEPVMQQAAAFLRDDIPGPDWNGIVHEIGAHAPETLASLIPFVLVASGHATFRDAAEGRAWLRLTERMKALGIPEEEATRIANTSSYQEALARFRAAWEKRKVASPEQRDAVAALDGQALDAREIAGEPRLDDPGEVSQSLAATVAGVDRATTIAALNEATSGGGIGLTRFAYQIGRNVQSLAEVLHLRERQEFWLNEGRAKYERANKGDIEALEAIQIDSAKSQFYREAYEAATGTGSAVTELAKDPSYSPPFPNGKRPGVPETPAELAGRVERQADGTWLVRDQDGQPAARVKSPEAAFEVARRIKGRIEVPLDLSSPGAVLEARARANDPNVVASVFDLRRPNRPRVAFDREQPGAISSPEVLSRFVGILKALNIPEGTVRFGRLGRMKRTASGFYNLVSRIIRVQTANNLDTAAHEIAHALDHSLGLFLLVKPARVFSTASLHELEKLGHDLYGDKRPTGGYRAEGWAEFMRLHLTDSEKARTLAPETAKAFAKILASRPKLAKAIAEAQKAGELFYRQGTISRAEQGIVTRPGRFAEAKAGLSEFARNFQRHWIEAAKPVADFVQAAERVLGRGLPKALDPFETLTARRLTADSIVDYMARYGTISWSGHPTGGKPLADAFKLVKGHSGEFILYLWAKRGDVLWRTNRNPGIAREDVAYLLEHLDSERFRQAAQIVYDWNNAILQYAAEASSDFARVVEKIRKADPGFYIPLFREFEAFDQRYAAAGGAKGGALVKRLRGSGRRIKDPIESMLAQARQIVLKAQQKAVLDQILAIAHSTPGLGSYVVKVPEDQLPVRVPQWQLIKQLHERFEEALPGMMSKEELESILGPDGFTFFTPAFRPKQNDAPVLPVVENGKVAWYEMDPELYASLTSMDMFQLPKALDLFLGLPARSFRLGTTGLRAAFSIVTNPLRDLRTLQLNSQASANSARLFGYWLASMRDAAMEAFTFGRVRSEWSDLFDRLGVEMATYLGQDTRPLQRAARRLKRGGEWSLLDIRDHFDLLREILQFPEVASRMAEMRAVAADLGYDPKQPLTVEIAQQLAIAAKQVTTDFTAAGDYARAFNAAIPFFNASIQGPRAHVRAFRRDPARFMLRGLQGTALALALWYRNKDEEWWREMPSDQRYLFTYIPIGEHLLRLPRSFEADGIFMAMTEALADAWHAQEPERVAQWGRRFLENLTQFDSPSGVPVPPLPVLPRLVLEQAANRQFFFDRPIVPAGEAEGLPAEEQYGAFTTNLAIRLGELFNVSPRRIDHLIGGLFGGAATDVVALLGRGAGRAVTREKEFSDIPIFGVLFQRGGQHLTQSISIDELYDRFDEVTRARARETAQGRQIRLMLGDAVRAQTALSYLMRQEASTEKRAALQELRIQVAREAVEMAKTGQVRRDVLRQLTVPAREQAERLREKQTQRTEQ